MRLRFWPKGAGVRQARSRRGRRSRRAESRRGGRLRFESLEPRLVLQAGPIVINELHVNPDVKTEPVEYIELYNNSAGSVDLSNWYFSDGVLYTIPAGTSLQAWNYLLVSQNPTAVQNKFGVPSLGPWDPTTQLGNDGDHVVLRNAAGAIQDEVNYGLGYPWPTVGDPPGYSMELINPNLDNNLGGSWRSSQGTPQTSQVLLDFGASWKYFKGTQEPSATQGQWRQRTGYDDSTWLTGPTGIGFGNEAAESALCATTINDMLSHYTTLYFRNTFTITDPSAVSSLLFDAWYDDGINVWINGVWKAHVGVSGENLPYTATSTQNIEASAAVPFTLDNPSSYLVAGTNVIAVQVLNYSASSGDCLLLPRLSAIYGGNGHATPGARNTVFAANAPPQTRQVDHSPNSPYAGQNVTITVKATDPDGVAGVALSYQLVNPGDYISIDDARYNAPVSWTTVAMYDDGTHGDGTAHDDTYTAVLPGSLQTNRRLVRYRITAVDALGASITVPYADDPQPNFAYYVYNGVPDYTASARPGVAPNVTYPGSMLDNLTTYQLITTRRNHVDAMNVPYRSGQADQMVPSVGQYWSDVGYPWAGTLVYDGVVYDHIHFRARGGVWRYSMGKNMWKFDFNRGHEFEARDNYGNKYDVPWQKLNLGACIQQGNFLHRGEQGMFESVGWALYNLAGQEASNTNFVAFRIVEGASETGPDQYSGDFQGLYLAVEQPDGNLLDEHGMPDGNLYKMEGGTGSLNNQGPTQPTNGSDLSAFMSAYGQYQSDQWWRDNFDLESYYNFRAITEAIHQGDIGYGKNYFYYHNPVTGKWQIMPWDLDLTWSENMYGNGEDPFKGILSRPAFALEYRNRLREVLDLLYNTEQTGMLIDEMARLIYSPGQPSFVDADRAMWDYNPILGSSYVNSSKAGYGRFYEAAVNPPGGFAGMVQSMKNYITFARTQTRYWMGTYGPSMQALAADSAIPNTPTITYTGPGNHPLDQLAFQSSAYSSPAGSPFAAMQWRIAKVTDTTSPTFDPTQPRNYEINATWESGEITTFNNSIVIPSANLEVGATYRVRVRMKDGTGRWSHWSNSVQLVTTTPVDPLVNHLRISEIMYNPPAPTAAEIAAGYSDNSRFEYIELVNTYSSSLALNNVQFVTGITYTFGDVTLGPGERIVVAKDPAAFAFRYGAGINVVGPFTTGSLADDGETIRLVKGDLALIQEFTYQDSGAWPGRPDGHGSSLEAIDTAGDYGDPTNWRASSQYGGSPGRAGAGPLQSVVINEVVTHTNQPQFDSIELYNSTSQPIDIGGWYLSDGSDNYREFRIPAGTLLGGNQYKVFTEEDYGISPYATATEPGDGVARVEDAGATLHLIGNTWRKIPLPHNITPNTVLEFDYMSPRQGEVQGIGFDNDDAANSDYLFRLYGTTPWGISTYANYAASAPNWTHYTIPVGSFYTGSMSYLVMVNDDDAADQAESYFRNVKVYETTPGSAVDFGGYLGLSAFHGDDLWLLSADAQGNLSSFVDHVEFGATEAGESLGRWPNGAEGGLTPMLRQTLGGPNSEPRVGSVLVSEVMYNPPSPGGGVLPDDLEFIEVYNAGGTSVLLSDWRIRGGVDFDFAPGTTLAAGASLVVLPFDPNNPQYAAKWTTFCSTYGLNASNKAGFVGGYKGHLDDSGATVSLEQPGEPPRDEPTFIPHLLEDEVAYSDVAPWPNGPGGPDGGGTSLNRRAVYSWGNDGNSWLAALPSPRSVSIAPWAAVAERYVFYNNSAFDGNNPLPDSRDDSAIATGKAALLPGQSATLANVTNYSRGINGIMIDVVGLGDSARLGADDFRFRAGNTSDPSSWAAAPAPLNIAVRPGEGVDGSDRVTITWADGAIQKEWLQVTVLPGIYTGLATPDVFYFGNAPGDSGNDPSSAAVDSQDELAARGHRSGLARVPITSPYDYNRDGRVNAADDLIARHNQTGGPGALQLIAAPFGAAMQALAVTAPDSPTAAPPGHPVIVAFRSAKVAAFAERKATHPVGEPAAHDAAVRSLAAASPSVRAMPLAAYAWLDELSTLGHRLSSSKPKSLPAALQDAALAAL